MQVKNFAIVANYQFGIEEFCGTGLFFPQEISNLEFLCSLRDMHVESSFLPLFVLYSHLLVNNSPLVFPALSCNIVSQHRVKIDTTQKMQSLCPVLDHV